VRPTNPRAADYHGASVAVRLIEWLMGSIERALAGVRSARLDRAARLTDRPYVEIANAIEGERVRIVGRVRAGPELLRAPLSERRCVFWEIYVDRRGAYGRWVVLHHVQRVVPFALEDESGLAEIRTGSFTGWSLHDAESDGTRGTCCEPARMIAVLDMLGVGHGFFGPQHRVREGVFEVDEEIATEGRARWSERDQEPAQTAYRSTARARHLVIDADDEDPVVASDDPEGPY
jgi:hypothetical protein